MSSEENAWRGKALAVSAHGMAFALVWQGDRAIAEFVGDQGGHGGEGFSMEHVDHEQLADGVYIGELALIDDGEGDYPGTREAALTFRNARLATLDEWEAHHRGEWPWEPIEHEPIESIDASEAAR